MKNNVSVTVVVPACNAEAYIKEAIDSVLKQSYQTLEIIIVDDGSHDRTVDVCKKMARNDNRISILKQNNGGVSSARNLAIKEARGEYILFLDSDDCLAFDAIEALVRVIERTDADLVGGLLSSWYKNSKKTYLSKDLIEYYSGDLFRNEMVGGFSTGRLYKTKIIKDNGILFPDGVSILEDLIFNLRYIKYSKKNILLCKTVYYYRMRKTSATNGNQRQKRSRGAAEAFDLIEREKLASGDWYSSYKCRTLSKNYANKELFSQDFKISLESKKLTITQKIKTVLIVKTKIIYDAYMMIKNIALKKYE